MTEQEQIEEMAKIIDDRLIEAGGWLGSMNRGKGYWIAQKLVEHYQPKIPESSVVISKEEYDTLKAENDKYVKDCIDYIATINKLENKVWEVEQQVSKETAEKIFEVLYQWLDLENIEKYGFVTIQKFDFLRKFREIYKQFGVGVEE